MQKKYALRLSTQTAMKTLAIMFSLLVGLSTTPGADRPNILFIVADDLNCSIGPYDPAITHTPHLTRLAERGVVFRHAYCQQAVCNPSRSSFLTGLRPDTVQVDDLRKYFRETAQDGANLVTLPEYFKNHGYFCQNIGKLFHNMGDTQDRQSWSIDEVLFKGTHAADTVYFNTPSVLRRQQLNKKAPVTEALEVPDIAYRDGQIANLAASVLRSYPQDGQPFFLAVGFWRPHLPFVAPKKYWDAIDPSKIPPPDPSSAPIGAPEIAMHASREIRGYAGVPEDRAFSVNEIQHFRHGYHASIKFLDAQVGRVLEALEHSGHSENTIVVFTSDHGFHIGEQGLWGKTSNFELDARVPLIIADPRKPNSHGEHTDALSELVDLYPTLAEMVGLSTDLSPRLEGLSLAKVVEEPSSYVKDAAFTQHQQPFYGSRSNWQAWGYSIRTIRWRYTMWRAIKSSQLVAEELYDHSQHSKEATNVIQQHPEEADELRQRILRQFAL